ncbi:Retrovirus-related Pol polyprotein from transposon gypsy, partial [Mucuna pruriens]
MFTRLMNHVLSSIIGRCMVVYFDDVLVYFACLDDHITHVQQVLQLLKDEFMYGVQVYKEKVKAIQSWPTLMSGFASFYRCFVRDFNIIVAPLNEIIKKDVGFRLSNAHVQTLPKFHKSFVLEYDVFNMGEEYPIVLFSEKLKEIPRLSNSK